MGKFMRKCKGIGEVGVMEVSQVGVRTRARTLAAMAEASASVSKQRRFCSDDQQQLFNSSFIQLRSRRKIKFTPENSIPSCCSDDLLVSRCSSNGSTELVNESSRSVIDLEEEDSHEFENSSYRDSDLHSESNNLESTGRPSEEDSRHESTEAKMPTESEIEDFFSFAEKDEEKRFAEKYNYDIVKDSPLEGRYEWVELKT